MTKWADYLKEKGLDPENQLSTDDFAGHLAHNANLSIKAIVALGAYAQLCGMTGRQERSGRIPRDGRRSSPSSGSAMADDGDHYVLAFDKPGTWSQKYNLVWDKVLGLNLFPAEVRAQGNRLLQDKPERVRPAARQPVRLYQARLDLLDRHAGRIAEGFRRADRADVRIRERIAHPRAVDRLVLDAGRETARISGALGGGRPVYEDAGRRRPVEEVGRRAVTPFFTFTYLRPGGKRYLRSRTSRHTVDMRIVVPSLFFALLGAVVPASAQSPYVSVIGLVDKIDTAGKAMTVKEENGTTATVKYDETATSFLLLPPGEKDTKKATPAKLENVGVGDHVLARVLTADPTGKPARTVYIEKADALAKEKADEWKNDTEGTVISVDAGAKQIKFNARQTAGPAKEMTVNLGGKVLFTRYNPATAKYDPSALASIKVGDQLRVIGEKNADSTEIKATVIGSATFRAVGVLVKTVDAANHHAHWHRGRQQQDGRCGAQFRHSAEEIYR